MYYFQLCYFNIDIFHGLANLYSFLAPEWIAGICSFNNFPGLRLGLGLEGGGSYCGEPCC